MGIQGLLPCLRSVTRPIDISELRGQAVAVDSYVWLHRGLITCARELCEGTPTDKCASPSLARPAPSSLAAKLTPPAGTSRTS